MDTNSRKESNANHSVRPRGYWRGMSYTLTSGVLWGSTYPAIALALNYASVFQIAFYRALFCNCDAWGSFSASRASWQDVSLKRTSWHCGFGLCFGCSRILDPSQSLGLLSRCRYLIFSSGSLSLIAIVLASIILRESMTKFRALGVVLGIAGTYVIAIYGRGGVLEGSFQ